MTLLSQSAGHTKGPWYVDVGADNQALHEDEPVYGAIRDKAEGLHIARIWNDLDGAEANAALIARAPDLLAENSKLKGQLE